MMMWLLLYAAFTVALLVTGLPVMLGRAETTHAATSDPRPPLPPY
jgi:hypothetical protein